jgi:hypothetical protein
MSISSFSRWKHRLMSFSGCFGPLISMLMCMCFLFMRNQGRLYIHTNTGHVLCVLLRLPKGLSLLVLATNLMFIGSALKPRYSVSNPFHLLASEGCVCTMFYPSFWLIQHCLLSFHVPVYEPLFLAVWEIPLQMGNRRKVPHIF